MNIFISLWKALRLYVAISRVTYPTCLHEENKLLFIALNRRVYVNYRNKDKVQRPKAVFIAKALKD